MGRFYRGKNGITLLRALQKSIESLFASIREGDAHAILCTIIIIIYTNTMDNKIYTSWSIYVYSYYFKEDDINSFRLIKLNEVMKFLMIYGSASKKEGVRLQGRSCDDILSP